MAQHDDAVNSFKRISHRNATPLTASNFALSGGFGSTATVSSVLTGSTDSAWSIVVTSSGTGQGANPTITLTFTSAWFNEATGAAISPIATITRNGGSQLTVQPTWTSTSTTLVITFPGTPVAAETYTIVGRVTG